MFEKLVQKLISYASGLCVEGRSTRYNFQNQSFLVLMPFAHENSERLSKVVENGLSTASYSSIIIVIPDLAQALAPECICNEHACEKPRRRQV